MALGGIMQIATVSTHSPRARVLGFLIYFILHTNIVGLSEGKTFASFLSQLPRLGSWPLKRMEEATKTDLEMLRR